MPTTFELLKSKRNEIYAIASKYGVDNIRVFGSVARGEDAPASDIDFLIRIGRERSLMDLIAFKQETQNLLARECDVVSENGIHRLLENKITAEAKPL